MQGIEGPSGLSSLSQKRDVFSLRMGFAIGSIYSS